MKRFLLALTILMVFSFGLAQAVQIGLVGGVPSTGYIGGGQVAKNVTVTFTFEFDQIPCTLVAFTNGFEVYTKLSAANPVTPGYFDAVDDQGVDFDSLSIPAGWLYFPPFLFGYFDDFFFVENSTDGLGKDTVGFGAVWTSGKAPGLTAAVPGNGVDVWYLKTAAHTENDTLCIDSAWFRPSNDWIWSLYPGCTPASVFPTFGGPYCYEVVTPPNFPPIITNCIPSKDYDHCLLAQYDFAGDITDGPNPHTWTKLAGPGALSGATDTSVHWSYSPTIADVGTSQSIKVEYCDNFGACDTCEMSLNFTNEAPTCTCPSDTPAVAIGGHIESTCTGHKNDCDPIFWFLVGVSPDPAPGVYGLVQVGDDGKVTFDPANTTPAGVYTFTFGVTDTKDTTYCEKSFEVVTLLKWDVVIENIENVFPGQFANVCVNIEQGTERIGGFDILIAYDASVLNFQSASEGDIYADPPVGCKWEYFEYRFGPFGNCGTACPSGMLRVVGMAEINNGPLHPVCFGNPPAAAFSLFCLTFYVANNNLYECQHIPIRFYWFDCADNSLSSKDGDTLWVSKEVFEKGGGPQSGGPNFPDSICREFSFGTYCYTEITDMFTVFPTYSGVQDECLVDPDGSQGPKLPPIQFINFFNGGIGTVCIDTLDDRGDINLNGVKNEIADAVMFTNYFIYGLGVFKVNPPSQIAATDINADGLTLSVADLVYLVRVIVGDAVAYPKLAPVTANYTNNNGVLSVDAQMGAAYVVVRGNVTPELLADQMELLSAYDAEANVTRVLVYSLEGHGFNGEFLNANGNVVSIEMGSYEGAVVKLNNLPANFALNQNYPNPFNPTTTISFNLPVASDYSLIIYNVTGQEVETFTNQAEAGVVEIEWDASTMASGVYFYKLTAGDFSDTKKMVLLK